MPNTAAAPLSASEAARVIGVSVQTIRTWADTGRLASVRTETGWRLFARADVERLAADREAGRSWPTSA